MELGGPSYDEVEKADAAGRPEGDQGEAGGRGVAKAAYFRRYRRMRIFGFKWASAEYEWLRGRLTDYNIGRTSGYDERRASFRGHPKTTQTRPTFTWARREFMKERAPGAQGRWKAGRLCKRKDGKCDGESLGA